MLKKGKAATQEATSSEKDASVTTGKELQLTPAAIEHIFKIPNAPTPRPSTAEEISIYLKETPDQKQKRKAAGQGITVNDLANHKAYRYVWQYFYYATCAATQKPKAPLAITEAGQPEQPSESTDTEKRSLEEADRESEAKRPKLVIKPMEPQKEIVPYTFEIVPVEKKDKSITIDNSPARSPPSESSSKFERDGSAPSTIMVKKDKLQAIQKQMAKGKFIIDNVVHPELTYTAPVTRFIPEQEIVQTITDGSVIAMQAGWNTIVHAMAQMMEGTLGHDHGLDDDDNQDDPPSGTGPSTGGATTAPSNHPGPQSEPPPPSAPEGDKQEDTSAAGPGEGSQKQMAEKGIIPTEGYSLTGKGTRKVWLPIPKIVHVEGKKNVEADALSRKPQVSAVSISYHKELEETKGQYAEDEDFARICDQIVNGQRREHYTLKSDYLMMHGKLCVTKQLQPKVLIECHASPYTGHRGIDATVKAIDTFFYWPSLQRDVNAFVRSCLVCQKVKFDRQKTPGLLQPLPTPNKPWKSIAMDFIFNLPRTPTRNDEIWTIICSFSKQAHFVPVRKKIKFEHMVKLFMHNIFKYHGMPQSIVNDKDPRITRLFWKALFGNMGTTLKFSSSFHPQQMDSQKRQILLSWICSNAVSEHKATWEHYLPLLEYAYNNTVHT
ncbi:hypothetical protein L7F22_041098 [Adiantum nelumboides]|nr:hypothetical protein [Adiantum nelumboides]